MTKNKVYIKLTHAEIQHLGKHIYLLKFDDNYEVELKDAKEVDKAFIDLLGNRRFSVVLDARNQYSSITNDARDFFANDPEILHLRKKIAIVVNNIHTKLLANFFVKFNKPQTPTKIFNDYDKALKWLKEK